MSVGNVLVNDKVRIKVRFVDIDPITSDQIDIIPLSVSVKVIDSESVELVSIPNLTTKISDSEYYYDFVRSIAGEYTVVFTGIVPDSKTITVSQQIYVSSATKDYRPTITLREDEIITFAPDIYPLYVDPESIRPVFPDSSLVEIAEIIHGFSHEINSIFGITSATINPMTVIENYGTSTFAVSQYIRASTICELTRIYGYGGDDELSVELADLKITNRNTPRNNITRSNATTWCQIAAALRKEIITKRVGIRAVQPKGLPQRVVTPNGASLDPQTGALIYINDTNVYGPRDMFRPGVKTQADPEDPMPDRNIKRYD